jgi:hypothetical protein
MRLSLPVAVALHVACILIHSGSSFAFNTARRGTHRASSVTTSGNGFPAKPTIAETSLRLVSSSSEPDLLLSVNGDYSKEGYPAFDPFAKLESLNATIDDQSMFPSSPQLSFNKFLTMQDKRVVVTIRYSGEAGLKPYFLTVAKKVKATHPDVIIDRRILPAIANEQGEATFEILVDGKVVVGKGKPRKQKVARVDLSRARSVFVSMQELEGAITRARKRKRPSTSYGEEEDEPQMSRRLQLRETGDDNSETTD